MPVSKIRKSRKQGGNYKQTLLTTVKEIGKKKKKPQNNTKNKQIKKSQNQTKTKQKRPHPKTQKTTISNATEMDYFRPLRIWGTSETWSVYWHFNYIPYLFLPVLSISSAFLGSLA